MAILVRGITTVLEEPVQAAEQKALKRLGLSQGICRLSKTSIDARHGKVRFVHTVSVEVEGEEHVFQRCKNDPNVTLHRETALTPVLGRTPIPYRPVIIGFGPAGMFAGLLLSQYGYRPLILERGASMEKRVRQVETFWKTGVLDTATNVQFGEGGAGTFSDGKLTTRIGDPKCAWVLRELVRFGAPEEILYRAKPHIGTDLLRRVVMNLRQSIVDSGGEVRFETPLTDISIQNQSPLAVTPQGAYPTSALVLATGHSARDTFQMFTQRGFSLVPKPFSVGVRAEHLQRDIDAGLYGKLAGHPVLPPGEYQLSYREGERGVYTFCMCPGGVVVPSSSEEGMVVTNGMSYHARDGVNANAAVAVSVTPTDYGSNPLDGLRFQQHLEQLAFRQGNGTYAAPAQDLGRFLEGKRGLHIGRITPTYCLGTTEADFSALFPSFVTDMLKKGFHAFGRKIPGYSAPDTILTGVETRTSSPIRILRDERFQAHGVPQVYPCGEGAGYAGGIMSAAVDGLRVALAIMEQFGPPQG